MNKKLFLATTVACGIVFSSSYAADITTNTARMQAMDKITGKVSEIDVPVNGLANFGTFSILVRKCVTKSAEETPENTAFVDIVDNYQTSNPINIFKGWMFSSTPALNAVEHPIYDIWLLQCYNREDKKLKILSNEQLERRDTIPMIRSEQIMVSTSMEPTDSAEIKTNSKSDTLTNQEILTINNDSDISVINIDIDQTETSNENEKIIEEEFVSEGEENIEQENPTEDTPSTEQLAEDNENIIITD